MKQGTIADLKVGDIFKVNKLCPEYLRNCYLYPERAIKVMSKGKGSYLPRTVVGGDINLWPVTYQGRTSQEATKDKEYAKMQSVEIYEENDLDKMKFIEQLVYRENQATGADPEIFVVTGKTKKSLLPAFEFLPGKKKAVSVAGYGGPSSCYFDGFAAEFQIPSGGCHSFVIDYIRTGLQGIHKAAKKRDPVAELTIQGSFAIPKKLLDDSEDDHVGLGCQPSLNAYDDLPELPNDGRQLPIRFAGGHIHFGMARLTKERALSYVKGCDLLAGIGGVAIFADVDGPARRQFYGRAGEYRLPVHGLEYRVLSNAWLCHPSVTHLMFNLARVGLKVGGGGYAEKLGLSTDQIRGIINNCDVRGARKWLNGNIGLLEKLLTNDGCRSKKDTLKAIVNGGVGDVIKDFHDVGKNWKLDGEWRAHSNGDTADWHSITVSA